MTKKFGLIITTFFLILTTQSRQASGIDKNSLPAWFFYPSPAGTLGIIGAAHETIDDKAATSEYARYQAVRGFVNIYPDRVQTRDLFSLILGSSEVLNFDQGSLSFSPSYSSEEINLERLLITKDKNTQKDNYEIRRECDFSRCEPAWLCSPVQGKLTGMLGVSFRAASFRRQLELTKENAVKMLEYTYGAEVSGKQSLFRQSNSVFKVNIFRESFSVEKKRAENLEILLYTKAQCFQGETLISWMVGENLPPYYTPDSVDWVENPSYQGVKGSIGYASGNTLTLFSRQLEIAYEDALNKISKSKELDIKSDFEVSTKKSTRSSSKIKITHQNQIKPRIMGIYLNKSNELMIWAADSKDIPQ